MLSSVVGKFWALAILLGLVSVPLASQAAPILVVNGSGILTGVQNVQVGSTLYNVTLADGTCIALYSNCATFPFATQADATAASTALLAALESPTDFDETKIFGCGGTLDCEIFTAESVDGIGFVHGGEVFDVTALGTSSLGLTDNATFGQGNGSGGDSTSSNALVYALWTPAAVTGVPEPASLAIFGAGLAAFGVMRRKRKAS